MSREESSDTDGIRSVPDRLRLIVSILLTACALGALARFVDIRVVATTLSEIAPRMLALAVAVMAVSVTISSLRYQEIQARLSAQRPPLFELVKINLLTLFSANFLPMGAAADGVRVLATMHRLTLPASEAIEGVVHDRIMASLGLTLCLVLTLPLQRAAAVNDVYLLLQLLFAVGFPALLALIIAIANRAGLPKWASAAGRPLGRFWTHLREPRACVRQTAFAIGSTFAFALMMYWLAAGMSIRLSLVTVISFAPAIYLAQVIPFFYGGFGIREAVSIALFAGSATTGAETAMSLSLAIGICNLLLSIPGGVVAARYASAYRRSS